MTSVPAAPASTDPPAPESTGRVADRVFRFLATLAGATILIVLASVAGFLVIQALPAMTSDADTLAADVGWLPADKSLLEVIGPLAFGTGLTAVIALVISVPASIGVALFLTHFSPRRLHGTLSYLVDLLAAIPSVVYGLWGSLWLLPKLAPGWDFLADHLGFIPLFAGPVATPARTALSVSVVLAVMVLPIITSIAREIFLQTPRLDQEAALALGATTWEMVRLVVLPHGRAGVTGAAMLGLGRALGETMAVLMILSPGLTYSLHLLQAGQHQTISANIAAQFPETNELGMSALIATGLALFALTLVVNIAARWVVSRSPTTGSA